MESFALTRAGTIGPIARMIDAAGGSAARVFRRAGLAPALFDSPDRLILLRDQFRLLEIAGQETGDVALPARIATAAGLAGLGPYARHVESFPRLGAAIEVAYGHYARLLQAGTSMQLEIEHGWARWSYRIVEPLATGRHKNELLAIGFMLNIVRHFAGPSWSPARAETPAPPRGRSALEGVYGCELAEGERAAVVFRADLLDLPNPARSPLGGVRSLVPARAAAVVAEVIASEPGGRPDIDRVARRLGLARRTLQRRLREDGATFDELAQRAARERACTLLRSTRLPVTQVAYELGYTDAAHFTRAFRRWTGDSPRTWQLGATMRR